MEHNSLRQDKIKKLLVITQKIDKYDDVLGFMHGWVTEFAKHLVQQRDDYARVIKEAGIKGE